MRTYKKSGVTVGALLAGSLALSLLTGSPEATADTVTECSGTASVYGVLADGRLTFSDIDPANGNRTRTRVGPSLGFTPKAMATLNFNTLLVTSTEGALYRVDIRTNDETLQLMGTPTRIAASGWTHDKLTYDGHGSLYGTTSAGSLLTYVIRTAKPASVPTGSKVGDGFVLETLTSVGRDRLVGTTDAGKLMGYQITASGWEGAVLRQEAWGGFEQLVSPGGGVYYGVTESGGMYWYKDADPTDESGSDITAHPNDAVDTAGWSQVALSAAPGTYSCTTSTTLDRDDIAQVKAAGRQLMNQHNSAWANATQWNCLEKLWDHESGWRWDADNPYSDAYGIPQALPGGKMSSAGADWATNPLTQIKWGLDYIEERPAYGSPCAAWNFWQANHWY
ncbi:peptidase S1 and S6 [Streptomyces sp. NPDC047853]|uniref:aggregation-promoting factor C-terminal-like domain-containing protein n=1 Tax=Streptomyces sp. NPDC047853 TaxID=3365489 RepID=UPI003713C0E3